MPYIGRNHRGIIKHLEPVELSSDTKNVILNMMGAVYDLRDESDPIRKDWIKWHEEHRQCDAHAAVYSNKPHYTHYILQYRLLGTPMESKLPTL